MKYFLSGMLVVMSVELLFDAEIPATVYGLKLCSSCGFYGK